ncbi:MAG: hypothetical protein WDM76_05790 [Limisphaerales bacterium]
MFLPRMNVLGLLTGMSLVLGLVIGPATAADLTLRISGIPGESTTPNHTGDIALQSLNFGLANPNHASAFYSEVTVDQATG